MAQGRSIPAIASFLQRFNAGDRERRNRRTHATALDFECGWLHAVQANLSGTQGRWSRHATAPISLPETAPLPDPKSVGDALAKALQNLRLDTTHVAMAIPRSQAIVRILELPPASRTSEIASMVHFQISRDLPFRMEDALLDFQILESGETSIPASASSPRSEGTPTPAKGDARPTRVLAAVVQRSTVDFHVAVAQAAGLKLQFLGLRSVAAGRAALRCEPGAATGCVGFVSMARGEFTFDVWLDGALVFSRSGNLPLLATSTEPGKSSPQHPELTEAALLEVIRSLHNYESTPSHGHISRFLVAGTTGLEAEIATSLAKRSGLPAQRIDPTPALTPLQGNHDHPEGALTALGLALVALDPPGDSFDFLNPKRPPAPVDNRRLRRLATVTGILAILLSIAGVRTRLIRQREKIRADIQQEITLASKNIAGFRAIRTQARTLNDWSAASRNWLDHLSLLSSLLPPSRDLYVTSLSTSPRNTLSLSARIRAGEIVDRLSADLHAAGYSVKPPGITPVNDKYGYRFQVSLEIDVPRNITNNLDRLAVEERPPAAPSETPTPPNPSTPAPTPAPAPAPSPPAVQAQTAPPTPNITEDKPVRRRRRSEGGPRE